MTTINRNCTLAERLDDIPRKTFDLRGRGDGDDPRDSDPHRPEIGIWAGGDGLQGSPPCVTVVLKTAWGHPARYFDLSPDEARAFANMLADMADAVERETVADSSRAAP